MLSKAPGADAKHTLRNVRLGLVALNVLAVAICVVMLSAVSRAEIKNTEIRATNAAKLTEQSASAMLDKAAIVLEAAGIQVERQMKGHQIDPSSVAQMSAAHTADIPELQRLFIFDAKGMQICLPPVETCKPFNITDREHFLRLSQHPADPIKLYGPYVSRQDEQPILLLARSLRNPNGDFVGIISGSVPLKGLLALVSLPDLGPSGSASIRSANLDLLVRHPEPPQNVSLATNKMISPALQAAIARNPQEGVFRAEALIDGESRVTAYRRLPRYPLYVQMGIAADDFLAAWRRQVAWTIGLLALFAAASWQIARATAISLRRQALAQKLYDEAPCGYHSLDAQGMYLSINATELNWLGCKEEDVIHKLSPIDFMTDEGKATFATNFPKLRQTGQLDGVEVDLVGRHGEVRRVQINAKAFTDEHSDTWLSNSVMHDITALHQIRQQLLALRSARP